MRSSTTLTCALAGAFLTTLSRAEHNYDPVIQRCQNEGLSVDDCKGLLEQSTDARVVVLHSRTPDDVFYNQVVVPVDAKGTVIGTSPMYDSIIKYPFEWRGAEFTHQGTRTIGPWDCTGMQDVQCCEMIEASVPDRDVQEKFLDCWIEEDMQRDPTTGELTRLNVNADGTLDEATFEIIAHVEAREANERIILMSDLVLAKQEQQISREQLESIYARTRHLLRGFPPAQMYPYIIKNQLRIHPNNEFIPKEGEVLDSVLQSIFDALRRVAEKGGLHSLKVAGGDPDNVVVIKIDSSNGAIQSFGIFEG